MESIIETIIYLLAILGIILTSISFFDIFTYTNLANKSYTILGKNSMKKGRVEIVINISELSQLDEEVLLKKIQKGEFENLIDIVDSIHVQKS
ncbi:MAG: hypothetical protein RSE00_02970 [Clostridia bacterium]